MQPSHTKFTLGRSLLPLLLTSLVSISFAQDGVSSASAARAKYLGTLGIIPTSKEIAVEEFINYHRHEIGRPKAGEAVNLDLRVGGDAGKGKDSVFQVGVSTALVNDRQHLRPLNLSLVIDKSGSMSAADKMTKVKVALLTLVSQLREIDTLSIVVFDSRASVLMPAQRVSNKSAIRELIQNIQPGSSTNIHAGLMLGYSEDLKNFRKDSTNRVVLLTDGIANEGVTEPAKIAAESLSYNDQGIDLSTIGVGLDLNKDLLRDLAKSGRGLFHFVADPEDIEKVFVKELQSLLSPVATEPNLEIQFDPRLGLQQIYGYEPKITENTVKIKLDNMNSGMTGVVMARFKPTAAAKLPIKVILTYFDLERKKVVTKSETQYVEVKSGGTVNMLGDESVGKNYTIAVLAQAIHDMAVSVEAKNYREAQSTLDKAVGFAKGRYPSLSDPDIKRTMEMALKYQEALRKQNGEDNGERQDNLISNGSFSQGNSGFTSELRYTAPSTNCLWEMGYTIAPQMNQPLLHRLFNNSPYSAPKRSNGNEQVFFANAGGTGSLTLWLSSIKCRQNTNYRVSFQSISLNAEREYVPDYEIRVNGSPSPAQPAGFGHYEEVSTVWNSGSSSTASLSIVRLPIPHGGGLIAITNIEMVEVK